MKGGRIYMLEKMFTTKMSMDKKKLQNRFFKIRSDNGKNAKLFGITLFCIVILLIVAVSLIIAVSRDKNYEMTEDEFSSYVNRPLGSVMASLDYVDDEKIVFHYLEGFFILDRKNDEIPHKINLNNLNIAGHQEGDCFTEFKIDKSGRFAYLTNAGNRELVKAYDNYIIDLISGKVKIGNMPEETELFNNYSGTATIKDDGGWIGNGIIEIGGKTYYLTVRDSVIGAIQLAIACNSIDNNVELKYVFGDDYTTLNILKPPG